MWTKLNHQEVQKKKKKKEGVEVGWGGKEEKERVIMKLSLVLLVALNSSRQFELAKGCNEVIMSSFFIRQLHVSRPDNHRHVHPDIFSCFRLCNDKYACNI